MDVVDGFEEGVVLVEDGVVADLNAAARDLLGDVSGESADAAFPESTAGTLSAALADPAETDFEEYYPGIDAWLAVRVRPGDGRTAVYLRDVTDRRERRQALRAREADLETVDRLSDLVSDLVGTVTEATDRGTVETTLAEGLVDTDLYTAAVVLRPTPEADGGLARQAAAGDPEVVGAIERVTGDAAGTDTARPGGETSESESTDGEGTAASALEARALDADGVVVSEAVPDDDRLPRAVRRAGFAAGVQSALAVPLAHDGSTYAVLGLYADRPDAFGVHERASLETLARAAGLAVGAARRRRLLLSDTVVELTLDIADDGTPLTTLPSRRDCTLSVDGVVPLPEGVLCYVSVAGASPETVLADLDAGAVEADRVVEEGDDEGLLAVRVREGVLVDVAARGAAVREATFETGGGRLVVDLPAGTDVREFLEGLATTADVDLRARREREREVETAGEFRRDLHERLTERQRAALRATWLAGYFESPRDSTAEEVAESLGIASPTLHEHLRAAERKVVGALVGDERPLDDDSDVFGADGV